MGFREILGKKILYFDGAMGTQLQARGLQAGELPELWNLTHPERVREVHRLYIEAGAQLISTNTFGANALKLREHGLSVAEIVKAAVKNVRAAIHEARERYDAGTRTHFDPSRPGPYVVLDMGPTGKLLQPFGDLPFEEAVELYAEQVRAGVEAGADIVLAETLSDTYEAKAAILAAKENSSLPLLVSFTFDASGRLLTGADVTTALVMAEALGADAAGFNCGLGPEQVFPLIERALRCVDLPLFSYPNAGLPVQEDGQTVFKVKPQEFGKLMSRIADLGVSILGGCCGTTPEHIAQVVEATRDSLLANDGRRQNNLTVVAGYGDAVVFDKKPVVIGERINPTGKKLLKEAIKAQDVDYICRLGLEQLERGAAVLDVNVGVPGTDEPEMLARSMLALQGITAAPLQLDSSNAEAIERALRLYNGRPLLNSVNGKRESLDAVLPLAKKYGAVVVALCLDDKGISATPEERLAVAEKIIAEGAKYGLKPKDFLVDPLALTVSTGADNAKIALETVRRLDARHLHTVMGVSNISFGLPGRDAINSAFLTLAFGAGLSGAIMNPQSEAMMGAWYAFNALSGIDEACRGYVEHFANAPKLAPTAAANYNLHDAIAHGLQEQSRRATEHLLDDGREALDIINTELIPALNLVGEGFERKTIFLPQLLMSADAAKAAFEVIKARYGETETTKQGEQIILATVKGDIHDIGKNIVKVLLENYGYQVIDLGKDVPVEKVVETQRREKVKLVGLTALMTTSVNAMDETIKALRSKKADCKILVGGAVLTQEFANDLGADGYAKDAVGAVNFANKLFGK